MYEAAQIRERILEGLAQHLEGFRYQVRAVKGWIANEWENGTVTVDPSDVLDEVYDPYYRAISGRRDQIDDEAAHRAPETRTALRDLNREYWQRKAVLDAEIAEATADLEAKKEVLSDLHISLEAMYEQTRHEMVPNFEPAEFADPEEAFAHIEGNGGWREWMEEQQIDVVKPGALTEAAQQHGRYVWRPDWQERERIREWMEECLVGDLWYSTPVGPGKTPEEMIREALGQ